MRDFINSRVVGGRQQITAAITFHTAGEQVLWPYGYTYADVPVDMTVDDHAALRAIGGRLAEQERLQADAVERRCTSPTATRSTGPTAATGSSCTRSRCIPRGVTSLSRFYPADEVIGARDDAQQVRGPVPDRRRRLRLHADRQEADALRAVQRRPRDQPRLAGGPARDRHRDRRPLATGRSRRDELPGRTRSRPVATRW